MLLLVLGQEDRLPVGVVAGPAGPAAHLLDLQHRDGDVAAVLVAVHVADDDPPGGQVDARGEGRRGHDALDVALLEVRLDEPALLVGEAGIMEGDALADARRSSRLPMEVGSPSSSMIFSSPSSCFSAITSFISVANLAASVSVDLRVLTKTRHCPPPLMESLTRLQTGSLPGGHLALGVVGEVDHAVEVDALLERGRPPFEEMCSAFSQSATSLEFLTVADRAMTCRSGLNLRNLVRVISSVGPRPGSWMRWTSSATTREIWLSQLL